MSAPSFPRQYAQTRRFTLGAPRTVVVAPDGRRILFLRSRGGSDPITCLWRYDVAGTGERLLADPSRLSALEGEVPPEELARRERLREQADGIVSYATDNVVNTVAFALSGRLWLAAVEDGDVRELAVDHPVLDPRPDPTGTKVAYVSRGTLRLAGVDGGSERAWLSRTDRK